MIGLNGLEEVVLAMYERKEEDSIREIVISYNRNHSFIVHLFSLIYSLIHSYLNEMIHQQ